MATVVYSNKGPGPSSEEIKHHRAAAESNCLLSFFEGGGPHWDKRFQSVTLGHFLFTPSCCSHKKMYRNALEVGPHRFSHAVSFSAHVEGQNDYVKT